MRIYIFLMVLFVFESCKRGKSKIKLYTSSGILFILMGFKDRSVGNDTPNYIELFERLKRMPSLIDNTSRFEKGYQLYNKLLGYFFYNYQILFIITAVICIGCISYGISKNSINWSYSLFLFVGFRFYYFFLSGLRQSIAVSIIFVAYIFLKRGQRVLYVVLIILATTFHFSAFIFIFSWILLEIKVNKKNIVELICGIGAIYIFFIPLFGLALSKLPRYYSGYLLTEATSTNNMANYIGAVIPLVFLIFAYSINYKSQINNSSISIIGDSRKYNMSKDIEIFFMLIASGISLVATRASILDRMVQYYWIFSICTIPNMIFTIEDNKKRTLWFLLISSFVIAYNIILLVCRPEWNRIVPYKFFW